jgi:hypothetical protein
MSTREQLAELWVPAKRDGQSTGWRNVASYAVFALTTPIIYSLLLPFVLLDVWVTLYQWICFPIYRIDTVRRLQFFAVDRHKLPYLNAIEKVNCTFCSYANGAIAYIREVAARTEQYWCPIRHARVVKHPHRRYVRFAPYGNGWRYRQGLRKLRDELHSNRGQALGRRNRRRR